MSNKKTKSSTTDFTFYSVVTVLGIGLTSLCVYGYRKYQDYTNENIVDKVMVYIDDSEIIEEEISDNKIYNPFDENILEEHLED